MTVHVDYHGTVIAYGHLDGALTHDFLRRELPASSRIYTDDGTLRRRDRHGLEAVA